MTKALIRINGIRLSTEMIQVRQYSPSGDCGYSEPIYQAFAGDKINIACLGLDKRVSGTSTFCCIDKKTDKKFFEKYLNHPGIVAPGSEQFSRVCSISVYPHHSSLNTFGFLIQLLGRNKIRFQHLVSSNAMISFVVEMSDQKRVLDLFEKEFDLPPTHTPFQQDFHDQTCEFVKQRYYETRATYIEQKIKTYGIGLDPCLDLMEISCTQDQLETSGAHIRSLEKAGKKFHFISAMPSPGDENACHLFCLTTALTSKERQSFLSKFTGVTGLDICRFLSADLISFHGPHFGDRFGIFNTAMNCFQSESIPILLAGCTGASICMVLPASRGEKAISALAEGFDTP